MALRTYASCRSNSGPAAVRQLLLGTLFVPMVAALAGSGLQTVLRHNVQPTMFRTCADALHIEVEEFKSSGESHGADA